MKITCGLYEKRQAQIKSENQEHPLLATGLAPRIRVLGLNSPLTGQIPPLTCCLSQKLSKHKIFWKNLALKFKCPLVIVGGVH